MYIPGVHSITTNCTRVIYSNFVVAVGDAVTEDEVIAEIETDKVIV